MTGGRWRRGKKTPAKIAGFFFWLLSFAPALAFSQPLYKDYRPPRKIDAGLFAGLVFPGPRGTATYADDWNERLLKSVRERTDISADSRAGFFIDAFAAYDFHPNAGIKLDAGYAAAGVPNTADFSFAWTWADGSSYERNVLWRGSGRLSSIPVSLDLVAKLDIGPVVGTVEGGGTFFENSFNADSFFGYGITKITESGGTATQYIDAVQVGLKIPRTSWAAIGANVGAELSLPLSEGVSLKAEARYFYCPKRDISWNFVTGVSDGLFYSQPFALLKDIPFTNSDIAFITNNGLISEMRVDPSFFVAAVGFAINLGRASY